MRLPLVSVSLVALGIAGAGHAQAVATTAPTDQAANSEGGDAGQIVVTAARLPGQVQTDIPPVLELSEADVAAYGATSIADLVAQLAPQTGSGRGRGGRPVFLVNGQRVSGFREFSRFPPESIRKVEVLPEEVALQFGFPADARVINFILKDDFASREVEAEFGVPGAGGYSTAQIEASLLKISGPRRINAGIDYQRTSPLTEAERGIIQSIAPDPAALAAGLDPADFRTLVARSQEVTANATLTQGLGELGSGGQLTVNGEVSRAVRTSLSGLDPASLTAIERRTATDRYALGGAFNRQLGAWRLSSTIDANRTDSDSRIDRRAAAGTDRALSRVWSANQKNTFAGSPFVLPAGEASLTLDAGYDWTRIESQDTRGATAGTQLTRGNLNAGVNLNVPIASPDDFLTALGDLSVNLGAGVDHLSDFGTLTDWNAGLTWKPSERLTVQASTIARDVAPGLSQLGGPQIVDVNVPVFDFTTGQTVLASVVSGGNPNLLAESQRDLKLSASYDFDLFDRTSLQLEYFRNRSHDTTENFPLLTPAVEAAFPGRVSRAADGTLVAIDRRPVTFAERRSERIRYGINLFGRLGKPSPDASGRGDRGGPGALATTAPPAQPGPMPGSAAGGPTGSERGRFGEMQARLCATPAGQAPDLTGLPERMAERLKGPDGQVDPARVAELRTRFCNADGTVNSERGPRRFDPQQFGVLRAVLGCGVEAAVPDPSKLPAEVAERLKGPDGQIDPARLSELRTRICAIPEGTQPGPGQWRGRRGASESGPAAASNPPQIGRGPGGGSGGRGRGGGGPMGMMGGRGDGQGRWNLSLSHSIELANRAVIVPGGPVLDLLEGDALGESGLSRHTIQLEGGVFHKGIGTRLSGNYRSASTVRGSGMPGSSDLRFGALATFDLRTFVNLEQQKWLTGAGGSGFWKGTRLGLQVRNLFDTRQRVIDGNGTVPLRYQPGLIDPTGRFFEIEFRKMF